MRKILAVWITKLLIMFGKLMGKMGSSTPGSYALKICPDILKLCAGQVKNEIVVVCGTNGKTTTNNLLNSVFKSKGNRVVCNNIGANMLPGVVTAFVDCCDIFGRCKADYACIEIDEMSAVKVFEHFSPDYMVITNLFRDQLDRYGEIDITVDYLKRAIEKCDNTKLVLNADDPLVTALGMKTGKECIFFGVGEDAGISLNEIKEGRFCSYCGTELEYDFYHYSQLGMYACKGCGFKRPKVDFEAKNVLLDNGIEFDVTDSKISVKYRGFYNIYNILATFSVTKLCGVDLSSFNDILLKYKPQVGRMEEFIINGKEVVFNLSKNPAGFNQAISTVMGDKRRKNIVTVINDKAQDGKDISWLWDVDFERYKDVNAKLFCTSGIRHNDLAVRLKYAEIDNIYDTDDIKDSIIKGLADEEIDVLYVLVNYTALFTTQNIIKGLEEGK